MTSFVIVEIRDHIWVPEFFLFLAGLPNLSCIYSGGRGEAFLLGFVLLLLLVLSGLIGGLGILGGSSHGSPSLGSVPTIIFYCISGLCVRLYTLVDFLAKLIDRSFVYRNSVVDLPWPRFLPLLLLAFHNYLNEKRPGPSRL